MRIGIDFDNTVICYDEVFNRVARETGLIPDTLPTGKGYVRDYLREKGKEDDWTRLQGIVYGTRLDDARLYDGVRSFIRHCSGAGMDCVIISHKTLYPYLGEKHNLHAAAKAFIQSRDLGVNAFFERTKEKKIERIKQLHCDVFIDDLPEFLGLPGFFPHMVKILFDPLGRQKSPIPGLKIAGSWPKILDWVCEGI